MQDRHVHLCGPYSPRTSIAIVRRLWNKRACLCHCARHAGRTRTRDKAWQACRERQSNCRSQPHGQLTGSGCAHTRVPRSMAHGRVKPPLALPSPMCGCATTVERRQLAQSTNRKLRSLLHGAHARARILTCASAHCVAPSEFFRLTEHTIVYTHLCARISPSSDS